MDIKNDIVISDMTITGNPRTKQVLITFEAQGLGKHAILLESAEMQVLSDEGIIEFWKTEIQKE
jgi:hypothetical protein